MVKQSVYFIMVCAHQHCFFEFNKLIGGAESNSTINMV
jgi:hypothetical protein